MIKNRGCTAVDDYHVDIRIAIFCFGNKSKVKEEKYFCFFCFNVLEEFPHFYLLDCTVTKVVVCNHLYCVSAKGYFTPFPCVWW